MENIILDNGRIVNEVVEEGVGNAGNININTGNLSLINGSVLFASTAGRGNGGSITLAADNIRVEGENNSGNISSIISGVSQNAQGDAGSIEIETNNLRFTGGGSIFANAEGKGKAGDVTITATDTITFDGENSFGLPTGIVSVVLPDAEGQGGNLNITTSNLNFTNGARIDSSTEGIGNAGDINITATDTVTFDGESSGGVVSSALALARSDAEGQAGEVNITTGNLRFTNGGSVFASTEGRGNAGNVNITATDTITFDGISQEFSIPSGIVSVVEDNAQGDAGNIILEANNIRFTNGGRVDSSNEGLGNAGLIEITADNAITFDGTNIEEFAFSGAISKVRSQGRGNAGGINIVAERIDLTNGGRVDAGTEGRGNAGSINIEATSVVIDGGNSQIRSGIFTNALNENGNGGDIFLRADNLTLADGGAIEATNFDSLGDNSPGTGRPGNINITADSIALSNASIATATQFAGEASGVINLQLAEDITLANNSFISAQAFGDADGGNLTIDARFVIAPPSNGTGNDLIAAAEDGTGGNVELNVEQFFGLRQRRAIDQNSNLLSNNTNDIDVSGGIEGDITINTNNVDPLRGATELPQNPVEPGQTTEQACQASRERVAKNSLTITGKGGLLPDPGDTLNSLNTYIEGESTSSQAVPAPIETAKGKIQPAMGVIVTKSGDIILTPYPTANTGERIPEPRICG